METQQDNQVSCGFWCCRSWRTQVLGYLQCGGKFGGVLIIFLCCEVPEVAEALKGLNQGFSPSRQIRDKVGLSLPSIGRLSKPWRKGCCRVWWILEVILDLESIIVGCVSPKDNLGQIGLFRLPLCIKRHCKREKDVIKKVGDPVPRTTHQCLIEAIQISDDWELRYFMYHAKDETWVV